MSNHRIATPVISARSMKATMAGGIVLPTMNSPGVSGVTLSCSSVPTSRSRTTVSAVSTRLMSIRISPITAGTLYTRLARSGLYQARVRSSRAPAVPSARIRSMAKSWTIRSALPRAMVPVLELDPSMISWTFAPRPAARSRANPRGT